MTECNSWYAGLVDETPAFSDSPYRILGFVPPSGAAAAVHTQQEASEPAAAEITALIETLQNDAAREKLIRQLEILKIAQGGAADAAAATMGGTLIDLLSKRIDGISRQLVAATRGLADVPALYREAVTALSDDQARARWIALAWKLAVILLAALLLEWLLRRMLSRPRAFLGQRDQGSPLSRIPVLGGRLVLEILPVAGFLAGGYAVLTFVQAAEVTRVIAIALLNAMMMVRVIMAAARMVLAPAFGAGRLVPLRDEDANYLFIWTRRLSQTALLRLCDCRGRPHARPAKWRGGDGTHPDRLPGGGHGHGAGAPEPDRRRRLDKGR